MNKNSSDKETESQAARKSGKFVFFGCLILSGLAVLVSPKLSLAILIAGFVMAIYVTRDAY